MRAYRCCHCGENVVKVHNLKDLATLAEDRKSVFVPSSFVFKKPRPAAFIINLNGAVILNLIKSGLYKYEPKHKKGH